MKYLFRPKIFTPPVIFCIVLGIISAAVWKLSAQCAEIADFFSGTASYAMRFFLTSATRLIPFSLAEFALFISVPIIVIFSVKFVSENRFGFYWKKELAIIFQYIAKCAAAFGVFMFVFTFTLGVCYGKTPVNEKMGFEKRLLGADDLAAAFDVLKEEIVGLEQNIAGPIYAGSTKMPYGLGEMNKKLNEAYKNMLEKHNIFKQIETSVKPVIMSVEMSKMHITGVYAFFTGEANINIDFPDYCLPFTAAHEMAHLMGIAREDEANFVAFLVCLYSDDEYIKYSGCANMLEYIGNALYRADKDRYYESMSDIPGILKNEMAAYSIFFEKYRNTRISKIAGAVNDTYLKTQGQEQGEKSYGLVVDLATVYLIEIYGKSHG
ncbi:MAG: DUF3810 domain-containing protein [Oscillospiraceae bacterium]|nr:DUF3810 domain-containing protein [Oscillospiraceae bacterium]